MIYNAYPLGLSRPDCRMHKEDMVTALKLFQERHGKAPVTVRLHPRNAALGERLPASVKLELNGGCLAWEIQLSADAPETPAVKADSFMCCSCLRDPLPLSERSPDARFCHSCFADLSKQAVGRKPGSAWWLPVVPAECPNLAPEAGIPAPPERPKIITPVNGHAGRPKITVDTEKVKELLDQGCTGRDIAKKLRLPRSTVARRLQEVRQGEMAL